MANPLTFADFNSAKTNTAILFSDFPKNFDMTPSGDLARIVNQSSILNSVENIVLTYLGERPYSPLVGSNIGFQDFENASTIQDQVMQSDIKLAIKQNEPRVSVVSVTTTDNNDNSYFITVVLYIINNPNPITLPILIKRNR